MPPKIKATGKVLYVSDTLHLQRHLGICIVSPRPHIIILGTRTGSSSRFQSTFGFAKTESFVP